MIAPRGGQGLVVKNPGGRIGWRARRYFPGLIAKAYLSCVRLAKAGETRRRIRRFTDAASPPLFSHVEIETINRCNGDCAFCPVNRRDDVRAFARMDGALFDRILGQLADMGYSRYLALFSNNEPLLDDRIALFAAEARRALPRARLSLSTNGGLLTIELFARLMPHLDVMTINNYGPTPRLRDSVRAIRDFCRTPEGERLIAGRTVEICLRRDADILTSRAGSAPNRKPPARPIALPCALPFTQMAVRPDGKVSLCCNDALGRVTLGDLRTETLDGVWRGEAYAAVRKAMLDGGRAALALCRECDFVKVRMH